MVRELRKYGVNVAGTSKTKWFGQAVYEVEGIPLFILVDLSQMNHHYSGMKELALCLTQP
jgi:hypothetical protein